MSGLLVLPVSSKIKCFWPEERYGSVGGTAEHTLACWLKDLLVWKGELDGVNRKKRAAVLPATLAGTSTCSAQVTCGSAARLESAVVCLWVWKSVTKERGFPAEGFPSSLLVFCLFGVWFFFEGFYFFPPLVTLVSLLVSHRTKQWVLGEDIN